jgi:hypothetical protein
MNPINLMFIINYFNVKLERQNYLNFQLMENCENIKKIYFYKKT